jgi:hypothetical protein
MHAAAIRRQRMCFSLPATFALHSDGVVSPKFASELRSHVRVAPCDFFSQCSLNYERDTHLPNSDPIGGKVDDKKRACRLDVDLVHDSMPAPTIGRLRTAPVAGVFVEGSSTNTVECACLPAGVLMPSLLRE